MIESEAAADPDTIYKMELENECYPLTEELLANDALILIMNSLMKCGYVIRMEAPMWE